MNVESETLQKADLFFFPFCTLRFPFHFSIPVSVYMVCKQLLSSLELGDSRKSNLTVLCYLDIPKNIQGIVACLSYAVRHLGWSLAAAKGLHFVISFLQAPQSLPPLSEFQSFSGNSNFRSSCQLPLE